MNPFPNHEPSPELEMTLRGWRPRQPSPSLKAALFAPPGPVLATASPERSLTSPGTLQLWFAPVTAAAMLVLSLATVWSPATLDTGSALSLAGLASGWATSHSSVEQNAPTLSPPRFRSTNAGAVTASFGFLLLRQTNVLSR